MIPLCHPLLVGSVSVNFEIGDDHVAVEVQVDTVDRTGVEMEALHACAIAALTVYDMCKSADRGMVIGELALWEKTGGRSGVYRRDDGSDGRCVARHSCRCLPVRECRRIVTNARQVTSGTHGRCHIHDRRANELMGQLVLLVVAAAWAAVLIPPLLRSRIENRPNSSVSDFRNQLSSLQRAMPSRGVAMRSMARPLAPSPLSRPAATGRPPLRSGVRTHGGAGPTAAAARRPQHPRATAPGCTTPRPAVRSHGDRPAARPVPPAGRRRGVVPPGRR